MTQDDFKPYIHKIHYYETDKMQITHHSNYVRFMEEARVDFLEQMGWNYDKFEEDGVISPVLNITCDYKHSTTYPDVLKIIVYLEQLSAVKFKLGYRMYAGETIVCTATSTHCFIKNGSPIILQKDYPAFYQTLKGLLEK